MYDLIRRFTGWLLDEGWEPTKVPAKWEICDRCDGDGHHGNPAFDGTSAEWWYEGDPDGEDLSDYLSGRWDVQCDECHGEGKVRVANEEQMTPGMLEAWHEFCQAEYEDRREREAELRLGY